MTANILDIPAEVLRIIIEFNCNDFFAYICLKNSCSHLNQLLVTENFYELLIHKNENLIKALKSMPIDAEFIVIIKNFNIFYNNYLDIKSIFIKELSLKYNKNNHLNSLFMFPCYVINFVHNNTPQQNKNINIIDRAKKMPEHYYIGLYIHTLVYTYINNCLSSNKNIQIIKYMFAGLLHDIEQGWSYWNFINKYLHVFHTTDEQKIYSVFFEACKKYDKNMYMPMNKYFLLNNLCEEEQQEYFRYKAKIKLYRFCVLLLLSSLNNDDLILFNFIYTFIKNKVPVSLFAIQMLIFEILKQEFIQKQDCYQNKEKRKILLNL